MLDADWNIEDYGRVQRREGWEDGCQDTREKIIKMAVEAGKKGMSLDDLIAKLTEDPIQA